MKILGIGLSHCSGVALIDDGKLVFAQEEDRFSRNRRHKGWPEQALAYMFEHFQLDESDIDLCVLCDVQTAEALGRSIKAKRTVTVHHHLAHVMSAWALSPWPEFDAVSIDGGGDFGSWQSFAAIADRRLEDWYCNCGSRLGPGNNVTRKWYQRKRPRNTFGSYWSVPAVINFGMIDKHGVGGYEGKLMGLAGHGRAGNFDPAANNYSARFDLEKMGGRFGLKTLGNPKIGEDGVVVTKSGDRVPIAEARRRRKQSHEVVCEYDLKDPSDLAFAADFAAHLQDMTNRIMLDLFRANFSPDRPVVASGGSFANVVSNGLLNSEFQIYVVPPMGDDGLALGAAAWGAYLSGIREIDVSQGMYLGFDVGSNSDVDPDAVAALLADNKVVGLMEGRMELGPRALGARSILADPRDGNANLSINDRLGRVEYMPFAPVILEEHADDILVGWSPSHLSSKHMTLVYGVQDKWRESLKGVVHVDGTVRPQVISRRDNPVYHDIVSAFHRKTGIPVLINTSFNAHGEPILRTIEEGLVALESRRIDALVAGNRLNLPGAGLKNVVNEG